MSCFPLDEPFSSSILKGGAGIQSALNSFEASTEPREPWTHRHLGLRMALGGLHPCPVGSVTQVADVFEEWVNEADCDGFNVGYNTNPGCFEDVVELLRPELVKRGLMWEDYDFPGETFRENLLGQKLLRGPLWVKVQVWKGRSDECRCSKGRCYQSPRDTRTEDPCIYRSGHSNLTN
jgi:hypothetical protein